MTETVKKAQQALQGKKTNLVGLAAIVVGVAMFFGWIHPTEEQLQALQLALMGAGAMTFRAALKKLGFDVDALLVDRPAGAK